MKHLSQVICLFWGLLAACGNEQVSVPDPINEPGIRDIKIFLNDCPSRDPYLKEILEDFEIRLNLELVEDIDCVPPTSGMPISTYQMPLIVLQALRVIRHMETGSLPWTDQTLYDWMKNEIAGINIQDNMRAGGSCCWEIDGKQYITIKNFDANNRGFRKKWIGIAATIDLIVHEVRHLSGPG
ncbi:MAG: hypothetical protein AAFU64_06585, partial [Bacteroidota bacterium]